MVVFFCIRDCNNATGIGPGVNATANQRTDAAWYARLYVACAREKSVAWYWWRQSKAN